MTIKYRHIPGMTTCIACGCDDLHACDGGCSWLRVDYTARVGVCSKCKRFVAAWDAGSRSAPVPKAGVKSVVMPVDKSKSMDALQVMNTGHPGSVENS